MDSISIEQLRAVPFSQRWEILKPVLSDLYLEQNVKLPEIMGMLKEQFGFDANEAQYKYQFRKKWKWLKNIPAAKKAAILERGQLRASQGRASVARFRGKEVDSSKLRRHMKSVSRKHTLVDTVLGHSTKKGLFSNIIPFKHRVFLDWNVPIGAMILPSSEADRSMKVTPLFCDLSSPSDISMASPITNAAASMEEGSTVFSVALQQKTMVDRMQMFIQGRHSDLVQSMKKSEIRVMSIWLYQFWIFGFRTAKNWGDSISELSAEELGFGQNQELGSAISSLSPYQPSPTRTSTTQLSDICFWTLHLFEYGKEEVEEEVEEVPFEEVLRNNLESNRFSSYSVSQLPLGLSTLAQTVERSADEMIEEALGFAIMARNYDLTSITLDKIVDRDVDISCLYPYHLAATYLDGSVECCNVFSCISTLLKGTEYSMKNCFVNDLGHTILDSLMITILKSHTSIRPSTVEDAWSQDSRFPGEDVDICGRWDADSSCYRNLLATGKTGVPVHWKHKFCHTSALAIVHCLRVIKIWTGDWGFNQPSGIFINYCTDCGRKLVMLPFHVLVMVAFQLAQAGRDNEDLFGIIACLLQMLSWWPGHTKAEISVNRLLGIEATCCDHQPLSALELARLLSNIRGNSWPRSITIGWGIMCHVLQECQDEFEEPKLSPSNWLKDKTHHINQRSLHTNDDIEFAGPMHGGDYVYHDRCKKYRPMFGNNQYLGHMRAAIQAELLTYRRSQNGDPWLSQYLNMDVLLQSLQTKSPISTPFVDRSILQDHCSCGGFTKNPFDFPFKNDVITKFHKEISNMDLQRGRGRLILMPEEIFYDINRMYRFMKESSESEQVT